MIPQETSDKRTEEKKLEKIRELQALAQTGEDSAQLEGFPFWAKYRQELEVYLKNMEAEKAGYYDSLIRAAVTVDQKLAAVDRIREQNIMIEKLRLFLEGPKNRIENGRLAQTELEKIQRGE